MKEIDDDIGNLKKEFTEKIYISWEEEEKYWRSLGSPGEKGWEMWLMPTHDDIEFVDRWVDKLCGCDHLAYCWVVALAFSSQVPFL